MDIFDLTERGPSPVSPGFPSSPVGSPCPSVADLPEDAVAVGMSSPDAARLVQLVASYPAFARAYYSGVTSAEHTLAAECIANKENLPRAAGEPRCGEVEKGVAAMFVRVRRWCEVAADELEGETRASIQALVAWRENAVLYGGMDREMAGLLAQHAPPPPLSPMSSRFAPVALRVVRGFLAWRLARLSSEPEPRELYAALVDSPRLRRSCLEAAGGDESARGHMVSVMLACAASVHARLAADFFGRDAGAAFFEGERFLAPLLRTLDAAPRDPDTAFAHRFETLALWLLPFGGMCRDARALARGYFAEAVRAKLCAPAAMMECGLAACSAQWAHYVARIFVQRSCWRHFDEFVRGSGMLDT